MAKKLVQTPVDLAIQAYNEAWAAKNIYKIAAVTHTQRVQSLYRRARRDLQAWAETESEWEDYLVERCLLRQRFENNRHIKDMRIAKKLLLDGEAELFINEHPQPQKFTYSPGGVCYAREVILSDELLDYWSPLEKAQYPYYFARREQRKLEYLKLWEMGAATAGGPGVGRLSEEKFKAHEKSSGGGH